MAALQAQLEAKQTEQAQCAAHVARCDAAIKVVQTKFAKSAQRLQSKRDAFAQAEASVLAITAALDETRARGEAAAAEAASSAASQRRDDGARAPS